MRNLLLLRDLSIWYVLIISSRVINLYVSFLVVKLRVVKKLFLHCSLQSRTQMIIVFLALVGFITFFLQMMTIFSHTGKGSVFRGWIGQLRIYLLRLFYVYSKKNKNIHHASNHRRSASSLCEDGKPSGQEVHHVGFQERFLWRYKLLNIIIWRNKHLCDFTNTWT